MAKAHSPAGAYAQGEVVVKYAAGTSPTAWVQTARAAELKTRRWWPNIRGC